MTKVLELFGEPISSGGQESVVSNIVSHMDLDGLHIDYLTPYYCDSDRHRKVVEDRGGNVFQLNQEFKPGANRFPLAEPLNAFFREHLYDVVHIHSGSTTFLAVAAKAAKNGGAKIVIVHSHSGVEEMRMKNRLIRRASSILMRRYVDVYCACSREARLAKYVPSIWKKVIQVNNGIDLARFRFNEEIRDDMRQKRGISKDAMILGHIGRFCHEKNHSFLLRVFEQIVKREPESILVLVGEGETGDAVHAQVREKGLDDCVLFAGKVDNPEDYLQMMDALVFPSRFEGMPVVLIEAQASGLPIVASDAVTEQVRVVDAFRCLSLDESLERWADAVLESRELDRSCGTRILKERGFDIFEVATAVRGIYCGKSTEGMGRSSE